MGEFLQIYVKPTKKYLRELVRLGLPSGINSAIFSLSMVVVQSLTNSFGPMCIATNVTFAGQNIGAGHLDRVETGAKKGTQVAGRRKLSYDHSESIILLKSITSSPPVRATGTLSLNVYSA